MAKESKDEKAAREEAETKALHAKLPEIWEEANVKGRKAASEQFEDLVERGLKSLDK